MGTQDKWLESIISEARAKRKAASLMNSIAFRQPLPLLKRYNRYYESLASQEPDDIRQY